MRTKVARNEAVDEEKFKALIGELSSKSLEVKDIIEREMRQLQRKKQR